jgi:tRNA-dihydrouridine synthase A
MQKISPANRCLSVAPMMDWTDRHCRYFHRLLVPGAVLYTEMVTTGAILHGDRDHLLAFDPAEHPLALQLGGSDPEELARCAQIAQARGFDEVNLNIGCPSDRVQKGRFGACLMREPELVRDCLAAMLAVVDIPVTVKTRLGVDELDSYAYFSDFAHCLAQSGCTIFIVHARKAWLSGLSPKENREVPELRYDWVYRLKQESPHLTVVLNGGVASASDAVAHLAQLDGVMLGRAAYHNPWLLSECSLLIHGQSGLPDRLTAVLAMSRYIEQQLAASVPVKNISRHLLGLFQGLPGARSWRRYISDQAHKDDANGRLLIRAMQQMQAAAAWQKDAA